MNLPIPIVRLIRTLAFASVISSCGVASAQSTEAPITTGPEVGQKIPQFEAVDQSGRTQNFESLRGRHGLLLLFARSADW